ncbi:MAG: hypothetical protein H6765_03385 [Candidatus Peribacteria bacterium]|nr:MAG: hypothetical protein H6765_03385 [Candidatus Peribacteria bacterium]
MYGKPVVTHLKEETQRYIAAHSLQGKYVAFLLLSDDKASFVYVHLKAKYAHDIGLESKIIDQLGLTAQEVMSKIHELNEDIGCIGIVVQLPLPDHLLAAKADILCSVVPHKDVDGL